MEKTKAQIRKEHPVFSGVIKYFPDAIMMLANVSWRGNEQHHPGTPLHWDRTKRKLLGAHSLYYRKKLRMKRQNKKRIKKKIGFSFEQDSGIFDYYFQVYIGMPTGRIVKDLKKYKNTESLVEAVSGINFEDINGCVIEGDDSKRILVMPRYKYSWRFLDSLAHEVHHMTFLIAKQKGFLNEIEATAYLFEYLFRSIRRRLDKKDK